MEWRPAQRSSRSRRRRRSRPAQARAAEAGNRACEPKRSILRKLALRLLRSHGPAGLPHPDTATGPPFVPRSVQMSSQTLEIDMPAPARAEWRAEGREYEQPHLGRTALDLATSVVPYVAMLVVTYLLIDVSVLLALAVAPITAG